jgi:hypothetical protein
MDEPPQLSSFAHLEQYKELCISLLRVDLTQEAVNKQEEHAETTVQWQLCGLVSSVALRKSTADSSKLSYRLTSTSSSPTCWILY